jgi:hypothetical protein
LKKTTKVAAAPDPDAVLALANEKPKDAEDAWERLCELLDAFAGDAETFEPIRPKLLKALSKWSKNGQVAPERWLNDPDRFGHLLCTCQSLILGEFCEDLHTDALVSAFAAPMPRLRRIDIQRIALTQDALRALFHNDTLSKIISIKLVMTGMCDAWLPDLLGAPALWTSLNELKLSEKKITHKGAALIADSPVLASLDVLSLKGSPIGDIGRRALGASPHLSDKAMGRVRATISASNAEAEAAPPAPREVFGEIRSLLAAPPSKHIWDLICDLFDRLEHSPERERVQQELIPYALTSLTRWPDHLRVAPQPWLDARMDGGAAHAGLQLARSIDLVGVATRADRLKLLAQEPALGGITAARFTEGTLSAKALSALIDGPLREQLRSLESANSDQSTHINALTGPKGPAALARLSLLRQEITDEDISKLARAPFASTLRELTLSSNHRNTLVLSAILALPFIDNIEALELPEVYLSDAALARIKPEAAPCGMRRLSLVGGDQLGTSGGATLARWLARCERLESLTLGGLLLNMESTPALLGGRLPAGIKRLDLDVSLVAREPQRWINALPTGLDALVLRGGYDSHDQRAHITAALRAPALAEATELTLTSGLLDSKVLRTLGVSLPRLRRLVLSNVGLSGAGIKTLASDMDLPALRALRLVSPSCGFSALAELRAARWWGQLESLSFVNSGAAGKGELTEALRALPASLTELNLSHNMLTDEQLRAVLESPAAASLRTLRLEACGLHAASRSIIFEALPSLKRLEVLELGGGGDSMALDEAQRITATPGVERLSRLHVPTIKLPIKTQQHLLGSAALTLSAKHSLQRHHEDNPFAL